VQWPPVLERQPGELIPSTMNRRQLLNAYGLLGPLFLAPASSALLAGRGDTEGLSSAP